MDEFNDSARNSTLSVPDGNESRITETLQKAADATTIFSLCIIMLSMGTDIQWKQIWEHLRRPTAIIIGMLSQFVIMPLVAFSLINAMSFRNVHTVSVLLMSCCPGGAVSNVFAYYVDGNVALSVTMTTLSTLFCLGLMPFNLWFYGMWVETGELVIPYVSIALSLVYATSPVFLGIIIRWKSPKIALWITKVFSAVGFVLIVVILTLLNLARPELLTDIPTALYVAVVVMPCAGFLLGFGFASVMKLPIAVRKTISLESGIQNAAVAFGIITISPFETEVRNLLFAFPAMYTISMVSFSFLFVLFYKVYKQVHKTECNTKFQESTLEECTRKEENV